MSYVVSQHWLPLQLHHNHLHVPEQLIKADEVKNVSSDTSAIRLCSQHTTGRTDTESRTSCATKFVNQSV